mmetsp:Transcript_24639/g.30286  ORF Transcript_24639/g.30286 Transcript_24639/m.30286 type:complete len:82 (-) Transcript_24639:345-590(-)
MMAAWFVVADAPASVAFRRKETFDSPQSLGVGETSFPTPPRLQAEDASQSNRYRRVWGFVNNTQYYILKSVSCELLKLSSQ